MYLREKRAKLSTKQEKGKVRDPVDGQDFLIGYFLNKLLVFALTDINFGNVIINQLNYGGNKTFFQKINYIRNNPIEEDLVFRAEGYSLLLQIIWGKKIDNIIIINEF